MVKEFITRSCGHKERVHIGGSARDKVGQAVYLASRRCWACESQARHPATDELETLQGWPILQGGPKQIALAATIRTEIMASVGSDLARLWTQTLPPEATEGMLARYEAAAAGMRWMLLSNTSARWWIQAGYGWMVRLQAIGMYITTAQATKCLGKSAPQVRNLCRMGRIKGARQQRKGAEWVIPLPIEVWPAPIGGRSHRRYQRRRGQAA